MSVPEEQCQWGLCAGQRRRGYAYRLKFVTVAENDVPYDILIAEDNLVNQKLAVMIVEKYGH